MKTCRLCGETKLLDDFYAMKGMRDGHRNECKACHRARAAERYRADPEPVKDRARRWQRNNRDRHAEYMRSYRASGRRSAVDRRSYLRRKYGMTPEEYDALLRQQGGTCASCRRPPRDDISLHVDHDHVTGARRGLLCFRCNNSLGDLEDEPDLLRRAAAYLDAHDPEVREQAQRTKGRLAALRD